MKKHNIRFLRFIFISLLTLVLSACGGGTGDTTGPAIPTSGIAGDGQLDYIVESIRQRHKLPALAAITIRNGQIIEKSAMGYRSDGVNIPVSVNDQWHIGSITKSMTSLLAALLVRDGFIEWTSTLSNIFPELVGTMRPEYADVRLDELLSHTSGLPLVIPNSFLYYTDTRSLPEQCQEVVNNVLALPSTTTRGVFEYSNVGYIIAGAMLERVTGSDWESLIQDYLFTPLVMTQAGFGAPDTQGRLSQPVGHSLLSSGIWDPWDPSVTLLADNPAVFGPAGTVHASLDDMAAYLGLHLRGLRGETVTGFLTWQEFAKLYTPFPSSTYALGWGVSNFYITHDGSNTLWLARAHVNKNKNAAMFIVTNAMDDINDPNGRSASAVNELLLELHARFDAAFL